MSDVRIKEACSCGATFDVTGSTYRSAEEMVERWRTDHRHEFAPRAEVGDERQREGQADALVERAETPPLGFAIPRPPGTNPLYGEDHR